MRIIYSPRYEIDLGLHVFPTRKYRLVRDAIVARRIVRESELIEPSPASWDDLALVHTREYLDRLRSGDLPREAIAQLELPWSEEMVDGFRTMVGGTIEAARLAAESRSEDLRRQSRVEDKNDLRHPPPVGQDVSSAVVCHVGGGLHHAFPNHGEGFCPFNDIAVAIRVLQRDAGLERAAIVDLDVHHGNGTAFIFESDPRVFTFSMHQQHNYPMWKPRGSLDIGLADGTHDDTYLAKLRDALPSVMAHDPALVFYLAGADPYDDDQLGGLRLTRAGLRQRDRLVIEAVLSAGVPLAVVLAGGYARHVADTVDIHVATVEEAATATRARRA